MNDYWHFVELSTGDIVNLNHIISMTASGWVVYVDGIDKYVAVEDQKLIRKELRRRSVLKPGETIVGRDKELDG